MSETKNGVPQYVLGFAFNPEQSRVALIKKNRPEWQAGILNGIGGHIEPGEEPHDAMVREFREEAGVYVPREYWAKMGAMTVEGGQPCVHVFCTSMTSRAWANLHSCTDETVMLIHLNELAWDSKILHRNVITWLAMATDPHLDRSQQIYLPVTRSD